MDAGLVDEVADRVLEALNRLGAVGRGRARSQAEVAAAAATNARTLRHATLALNRRGVPAVTTCVIPVGVFLAQTDAELADYDAQLDHRIRGLAMRLKEVRRMRRAMAAAGPVEPDGQRRLWA
jgi:hypothetical protein